MYFKKYSLEFLFNKTIFLLVVRVIFVPIKFIKLYRINLYVVLFFLLEKTLIMYEIFYFKLKKYLIRPTI